MININKSLLADVRQAFKDITFPMIDDYYTDVIYPCRDIYAGVPPWHTVKRSGLYGKGTRDMAVLNTAKMLCDELTALTFSEKTEIIVSDRTLQEYIDNVLEANGFYRNMPSFLAYAYALGGGVLKCYAVDGKPVIDYLNADCFIPTEYDNRRITGGIFRSVQFRRGYYYTLLEHYSGGTVEYKAYKSGDANVLGAECPLSEYFGWDFPQYVDYGTDQPMFAYFKTATANNISDGCLGLSVFANCRDTLKSLDIAFDSYGREFVLGRKRIIVPSSCIRTVVDPDTGNVQRYFDADDEVYQALKCDEDKDLNITDNTMSIRVDEHVSSINALLNILCAQTGLSAGYLSFDRSGGVKTATEIISENSKTFRTAKTHKNMLAEALKQLVGSLVSLGVYLKICPDIADYTVDVAFADNIIEDDNTIIDNNIKLVSAGLKSKISAIMEIMKCDEAAARKELEKIKNESSVVDDMAFDPSAGARNGDTNGEEQSDDE